MSTRIDPELAMGPVSLSVADLARSLTYYQHTIGLTILGHEDENGPFLCLTILSNICTILVAILLLSLGSN